jgi:hypothetical protein
MPHNGPDAITVLKDFGVPLSVYLSGRRGRNDNLAASKYAGVDGEYSRAEQHDSD